MWRLMKCFLGTIVASSSRISTIYKIEKKIATMRIIEAASKDKRKGGENAREKARGDWRCLCCTDIGSHL